MSHQVKYDGCVVLRGVSIMCVDVVMVVQTVPELDCKGIETVRRDQCPATAKIMDSTLRLLFKTKDLSVVKRYLVRQWRKILGGRVSTKDFIFAKEARCWGGRGGGGALPSVTCYDVCCCCVCVCPCLRLCLRLSFCVLCLRVLCVRGYFVVGMHVAPMAGKAGNVQRSGTTPTCRCCGVKAHHLGPPCRTEVW